MLRIEAYFTKLNVETFIRLDLIKNCSHENFIPEFLFLRVAKIRGSM